MARRLDRSVKRVLAASLLLLVVSCDTYGNPPAQGPYGSPEPYPYPAPNPYPTQPNPYPTQPNPYPTQPNPYPTEPQPYPPGPAPYPPGQAPYPGQPYQPAPPECPITASSGWTAWVNAMPGPNARPALVVTGKVVTATGGYQVAFDRYLQIRKGYPPQAFVTLYVAPPEGGAAVSSVITHEVRWEWPLQQPVGSVIVRCGDKTLAEITRIQTAY
jgi:hypothetical protein